MKRLMVFYGVSGSGKTTIINQLVKEHVGDFKKIITYTSRLPREGEKDGEDYYFVPPSFFDNNDKLVLVKRVKEGTYATRFSDLFSDTHHLLLASGVTGINKLVALGITNITAVHLHISLPLQIKRLRERGDTAEQILNRLLTDRTESVKLTVPVMDLEVG